MYACAPISLAVKETIQVNLQYDVKLKSVASFKIAVHFLFRKFIEQSVKQNARHLVISSICISFFQIFCAIAPPDFSIVTLTYLNSSIVTFICLNNCSIVTQTLTMRFLLNLALTIPWLNCRLPFQSFQTLTQCDKRETRKSEMWSGFFCPRHF